MRTAFDLGFDPGFGFAVTERTIMLQQQAGREGVFVSPTYRVPSNARQLCVTCELSPEDRAALDGRSCEVIAQLSDDGQTWEGWKGFKWVAPFPTDPYMAGDASRGKGRLVRLVVTVPQPLTLGVSLEVI